MKHSDAIEKAIAELEQAIESKDAVLSRKKLDAFRAESRTYLDDLAADADGDTVFKDIFLKNSTYFKQVKALEKGGASSQPEQVNKSVTHSVKEVQMDSKEHLMTVLQSLIHDKQEDATAAIRQAILVKSQSIVAGRQAEPTVAVETPQE